MTAALQFRALARVLDEARTSGEDLVPLLDAVLLAEDKPSRDDALQATGKPCQQLLAQLGLVLEEGRAFFEELGDSPLDLADLRAAEKAFEAEFASYRYHHEAEELAPRLGLVLNALRAFQAQLGLLS